MAQSRYPLVQPPPQADPVQTLSGLMQLGNQLQSYGENSRQIEREKRVRDAMATAKGDPMAAAGVLEKAGDFETAYTLKQKAGEIRKQALDAVDARIGEHKDVLGRGAQILTEIQQHPDMYPQIRPRLVELAAAVDPTLAGQIPEQYDEQSVVGMAKYVNGAAQATEQRQRALALAKQTLANQDETAASETKLRKIASDWFSVSPNQQDWDASAQHFQSLFGDAAKPVLAQIGGEWSKDAMERARVMGVDPKDRAKEERPASFEAALLEANRKGDTGAVAGLLDLENRLAAARHIAGPDDAAVTPGMVSTVVANPSLWADLTPSVRVKMLEPLQRAGFNFPTAAKGLTDANRAEIERWKSNQLQDLEKEFQGSQPITDDAGNAISLRPVITDQQLRARQLAIENAYRVQIGQQPISELPPSWGVKKPATPAAPVAAPGATPAPTDTSTPAKPPVKKPAVTPAGNTRSVVLEKGKPPMTFTKETWKAFVDAAAAKGVKITSDPFASQ